MDDFPGKDAVSDLVDNANYMVLSTAGEAGPHASPVFFAQGRNLVFYWLSAIEAQHSINIERNPKTSAVIFDSHAEQGTGIGFYFNGHARIVRDHDNVYPEGNEKEYALKLLCEKGNTLVFNDLIKPDCPRKIYALQVTKAWLNGAVSENGVWVDQKRAWPVKAADSRYYLEH